MHESTAASKPKQGWECPKCGSVYAPWVFSCGRCAPSRGFKSNWHPPISAVPERFRSTSAPKIGGQGA